MNPAPFTDAAGDTYSVRRHGECVAIACDTARGEHHELVVIASDVPRLLEMLSEAPADPPPPEWPYY